MPPGGQRTIGRHVVISLCAACTGCILRCAAPRLAGQLCLGAACTGCICPAYCRKQHLFSFASALPARGASDITTESARDVVFASALPARGASDHHSPGSIRDPLCLGAACTGCIGESRDQHGLSGSLPRRCLHGVHPPRWKPTTEPRCFASALPARGASLRADHCGREVRSLPRRCLHGVHPTTSRRLPTSGTLPRRCLHGVHRQKPTNCGTPFCSIRRESVDSFSEINSKDSCADYFPALFCCQGDLHHHYRQPRTDNRPVLRCEQHRLFLFILSSHYRRLL